ncbi:hypothetical protein G1L01_11440 [Tenacibaculum finnmarkense]|uniref:hypothetical protein n=1 Tax=Tenacibaculum finnmarkense TaxID=2781243 RepID=UPI001EFC0149|nr:hypothetical protein [Tenacibaculum finnmarkense]MCG8203232.1 hypothetical protein [Tenacibaculum finnmarkense genomovar finnmarkense]MCG8881074.1 hypothetical protein [Tenacibaculum finnmarkense]MCM8865987.1 hypothetical protein [Tenacibaculum finnmarkense genomovar finnmarkense]MCM8888132.1 hypothetical protein [Tenacibaculum finnmarkense genomovar finnmarkense]MCM8896614.1 hypothetical protein [Tenacibaculum finnmarkense genomovar finnmarkense]
MKKITLGFMIITALIIVSCTNTMDKPLNSKDFEEIKNEISTDKSYSSMKSKYIIDNLSEQLGFLELGKTMGKDVDELKISTFREEIAELTIAFDSISNAKTKIAKNNKKLENFIELIDANTTSIDKYKGYLTMKLKFNNKFEKEILYIIMNYKYVNKYDSKFFDEKTKLTDEVAGDFKDELKVSTTEKYNDVAKFMYTKVPVQAKKALRDELGEEKADKKVKHDFLMEGLKIETLGIVFKDKSELIKQDSNWKYLEK